MVKHGKKQRPYFTLDAIFIIVVILLISAYLVNLLFRNCRESFTSSPNTFDSDVANGQKLVWFYADWCGHCKRMHSAWDGAADQMNINDNVKMIKVNCGNTKNKTHQQLTRKYNITGYPTIMLLENGEMVNEYNDGRTQDDLVSYVEQYVK